MVEEVLRDTMKLTETIKNTREYAEYLNYKSIIERDAELLRNVREFQRLSFEVQVGQHYGQYDVYEKLIHLKSNHEELLSDPMVKSFLDAELKLSKIMREMYNKISDEIEIDLSFLE